MARWEECPASIPSYQLAQIEGSISLLLELAPISLQRAPKAEELCFVQDFETLIKIKRAVRFQIEEFNHLVTIRTSFFFEASYSKYSTYSVQTLTVRATPDISEVLLAQIQSQRIPHKATEFFSVTLGGSCVLLSIFPKVGSEGLGRLYSPVRAVHR